MEKTIFQFGEYKQYLFWKLNRFGKKTGARRRLAQAIQCQPTYVTQVLGGAAHFTLEQAQAINEYFSHRESEAHFFILLVQLARAGSASLRDYFKGQILQELKKKEDLSHHLEKAKQGLTADQQNLYYSSWLYAAVHMGLMIERIRSLEELAELLRINTTQITKIAVDLSEMGLVKITNDGQYRPSDERLFIGQDSIQLSRHHTHWRLQSISNIERQNKEDLHYTAIYSMSYKDREQLKQQIIELIKNNLKVVESSREESVFAFTADFFEVLNKN